jgi:methyl-accepting chemotaxis protein
MKDWKIGTRITAGFGAVIAIAMVLGMYARNRVLSIAVDTDAVATNRLPSVLELGAIPGNNYHALALLLQHAESTDPHEMDRLQVEIAELRTANERHVKTYADLPATAEEAAIFEKFKLAKTEFWGTVDHLIPISRQGTPAGNQQSHDIIVQQLIPQMKSLGGLVQQLIDLNNKIAVDSMAEIQASVRSTNHGVLIGLALCLGLAVPITLLIARSIALPLNQAVAALEQVAEGDLTVTVAVQTKDEVGRMGNALNATLEKLRSSLQEVAASAANSNSSSRELAAAAEQIASGAQEQAASLEETSASLEEITAAVRQSADSARQASQLATGSRESAEQGQEVVASAIVAMAEINAASARISDIISTINEIAFQTNLLAVNAAVEAARAGEEGRGFAVVATEVRSLAQRSAEAAKEIKGLIQDSLEKVEKGTELVNRSGATLQGIVGSVKRVTDIVGEIAAASAEQSTGVDQVNSAITQMDQVTQSNSAQTEELSSTAQSFAEQAAGLTQLVGRFKLGDEGEPSRGDNGRKPLPRGQASGTPCRPAKAATKAAAGKLASSAPNGRKQLNHSAVLVAGPTARSEEF